MISMKASSILRAAGLMAGLCAVVPPAMGQLSSEGGPIRVNADNSSVYEREQRVVVIGNVDIIQGDARLRADKVTLNYASRQGGPQAGIGGGFGEIEKMLADGNVYYITPDLKATGNSGSYDAASETITLTGEVVLVRGEDVARGERLVINVPEGRSTLRGGEGRVQMLIIPNGEAEPESAAAGREE
ncbi:MAG: OstA family protein [Alphaproteobacteria bacterium]|jgi:lipopolysaccharide export system protein LptA|nr:OstA family protein [Alphaproteobacteria bacterium]